LNLKSSQRNPLASLQSSSYLPARSTDSNDGETNLKCLHLRLYALDSLARNVRIVQKTAKDAKLLWQRSQFTVATWVDLNVTLQFLHSPSQLLIESELRTLLLSDLRLADKRCDWNYFCDLETETGCFFRPQIDQHHSLAFDRIQGQHATRNLPRQDATLQSQEGHYWTVARNDQNKDSTAMLIGQLMPESMDNTYVCVSFKLYQTSRFGDVLQLRRKQLTNNKLSPVLWNSQTLPIDQRHSEWHYASVSILWNRQSVLLFLVVPGRTTEPLALDDINVSFGMCKLAYQCEFDSDFCSFQQSSLKSNLFLIGYGNDVLSNGRPIPPTIFLQSNKSSARFLYTNWKQEKLDEIDTNLYQDSTRPLFAELYSPTIDSSDKQHCILLQFLMQNDRHSEQRLTIELQDDHNERILFDYASSTDDWQTLQIPYRAIEPYRILIRVENFDANYSPLVALHHYSLSSNPCSSSLPILALSESTCRLIDRLSCTFEIDQCGWKPQDGLPWELKKYARNDLPIGRAFDCTY
jgi:hypothetical protein